MKKFFVVIFKPGPRWIPGKSIFEQPLDPHVTYLQGLFKRGKLVTAGPFSDSSGGMTIMQVDSEQEARQLIDRDPNVINGLLQAELHPWSPIAWDRCNGAKVLYEVPPLVTRRVYAPRQRQN